ncbi:MAG TPA: hypothetical protein VEP90_05335, partial [Methylomirabilota bacterium]|nr:hypothetical protein [Methylomirabilota bacterium]
MTALDKVRVEIGYAIENLVSGLESGFIITQSLLAHIRRIPHHRIKSPLLFALHLIKKNFRELKFPVKETLRPGERESIFESFFVIGI